MAKLVTLTRVLEKVGSAGHVLHPTCHDDLGLTKRNGVRGHDDGLDTRAADLVDRHGTDRLRDSRSNRCLSGRSLAEAGAEHAPHIDVIHTPRGHANPLQRSGNGDATQFRRWYGAKDAVETAHRSSHGTDNDGI